MPPVVWGGDPEWHHEWGLVQTYLAIGQVGGRPRRQGGPPMEPFVQEFSWAPCPGSQVPWYAALTFEDY